MKNFIKVVERAARIIFLFFLFTKMFVCYGQNKTIVVSKNDLEESREEGIITTEKEKTITKFLLNLNKKSSKTLKKAADVLPPSLTCPPNKQLPCGSLVPNYLDELIVTDDSGGDIFLTQSTGSTKFYDGMTIVFTAKDETGNESSCSIVITALSPDVTPPTFDCPTNLTLNCGDVLPNYATNPMMNLQDDCSISVSWEMTPAPGTPFYNGIPVQIKYTDPSGNSSFCNFNVTQAIPDNIPPTLTCPGNHIQSCGSLLADYRTLVTGYDNCLGSLTVSQNPSPGTSFVPGMTVVLTVKDVSNNASTCSFIVNASADTTKPVLNCLGNQILSCGAVLPNYAAMATATDNCDSSPVITQSPSVGSVFTSGMTVTLTARDASNNTSTCSFIVNASADTTKPILNCLGNQILSCGAVLPNYASMATATDNCDSSPVITQSPSVGSAFTSGMTVTLTAKDASNNTSTCSFIVNTSADTTKPVLNCLGNQTLSCGAVLPNYASMATATDNCDNSPVITQSPSVGSAFTSGMTVTLTAKDASNNTSTCSFIVNALPDTTKPVLNCLGNQILSCGAVLPNYASMATATDNCDNSPVITQSPSVGSAFTSGMIVTLTAKDASNNTSTCSFIVNALPDTTKPIITNCPDSQTLAIGGAIPDYSGLITVTDNCDTNPTIIQSPAVGTLFTAGVNVVLTVKDISENTASCNFYVNALGGDLPPALNCPSNMELYANSTLPNYVSYLTALSDDTTDDFDLIFTQTPPQGTLFTGDTNVTITVKDVSGNINSCTFLVKLKTFKQDIDCKSTSINVSNIYGENGFSIYGEVLSREAGFSVNTAGDINGDGITDLIIGAPGAYDPWYGKAKVYKAISGAGYVVFGKQSGFSPNIDLGLLDGTNGFVIRNDIPSSNFPVTGYDVSGAGDINGDGIGDFMLSDPYRYSSYGTEVGHTYIIFGKNGGYPAELKISDLNGSNGFTFIGNENFGNPGISIDGIGDVNSDGFQDIAIISGGSGAVNGKCFVIYGKANGFPAILRSFELNGTNGFTIEGNAAIGKIGTSVAGLGDVNGDGISDIGMGSYNNSGQVRKFIVFGRSSNFPTNFNISSLNGTNGFIIENTADPLIPYDGVAKAGDLNNDGINDIAITGNHIIFGASSFPTVFDLKNLNGTNGFKINNIGSQPYFGYAGDFNGDHIDDYFVQTIGATYLFFGKKSWTAAINGTTAHNFRINSEMFYHYSASYAGDINNDGIGDLIIGNPYDASHSNFKVNYNPGKAYVVFGKNTADTEKPVITNCPADQKLNIGDLITNYTSIITVTDNCDTKPIISQLPAAGSVFDGTTQQIVLKATDASGNISECKFKVELMSTASPIIVCPTDQELYANSFLPNYVPFLEDVDDDITPSHELTFTQTPPVGTLFTTDTDVTITVKDKSGNESSCTFLVKLKTEIFDLDCNTTEIDITELDGSNGVILYGEKGGRRAGFATSNAGDINGDGIQDFLVGAKDEGCYVVFGTTAGFPPNINLGKLNGNDGFKIFDDAVTAPSEFAYDVSAAGDINGDRIDDLMLSDRQKQNGGKYYAGSIYIIYGKKSTFSPQFPISALDGNNGFKILGDTKDEAIGTALINIGDFNNDSHSDIAILSANEGAGGIKKGYVVFGRSSNFPASITIDQLITSSSFVIEGDVGQTIEAPGDINGDGIADLIFSGDFTKYRYVVFGSSGLPLKLNTADLNGSNGFRIENSVTTLNTSQYYQVKAIGDINGDSFKDLAVDGYVLFGRSSFSANIDLKDLNGTNGFKIDDFTMDYLHSYSKYGDFNADGLDDITMVHLNDIYIIYGKKTWNSSIKIKDLTSAEALKIKIRYASNYSISYLNDVNNDGIDDVLIGSSKTVYTSDPNEDPGISYLIFGSKYTDLTSPVITNCPSNQVLNSGDLIPDYTKTVTVKDNCDTAPKITQTPVTGSVYDGKDLEVIITAVDASGNTSDCKFVISTSTDTTPPVITCITDQITVCGTKVIPDFTTLVTVTDTQDANPSLTQNPIAGSPFVDGMTITITAKDISNNESYCTFKVNASADGIAPVIACIGDQSLSCGATIPDYTTLITVTDNCDSSPVFTQNPIAGSPFTDGMTITITAKDVSNNSSICSFKVNTSADLAAPVITCIGDQTLSCGSIIPDYTPLVTANDNCDASPVISQSPSAGGAFTNGMLITITAKDASNNESYCTFKVNASADVAAPQITCIGDQNLAFGAVLPDYRSLIVATDNCNSNLMITQTPIAGTNVTDGMSVTMNVSDNSGNPASCSFKIHVTQDKEAPVFACILDQMVDCSTSTVPDYTKMIFATDNTDSNPVITQTPAPGSTFSDGMSITIKVSDKSNNSSNCSFLLVTYPVLVDLGDDLQINEGESTQLYALALENGTFSWSPAAGLNNTKIGNPIAKPTETTTYKVIFTNEDGCQAEDFITITVIPTEKDETKYGFSPNGDGINDFWEIDGITDYPENEVLIYSRWGDLVFQTKGYNNSTNVFSGIANKSRSLGAHQLPEGTYFFEIRTEQPNHFKKTKGYLVLKR